MHFNTALPDYCGGFPSDKPVFLCGQPGALQPRRGGPSVRHWLLPQRWAELDSVVERLRGAATTAAAATTTTSTTTTAKTTKALLPRNRGKKYRGKIETEKNGKNSAVRRLSRTLFIVAILCRWFGCCCCRRRRRRRRRSQFCKNPCQQFFSLSIWSIFGVFAAHVLLLLLLSFGKKIVLFGFVSSRNHEHLTEPVEHRLRHQEAKKIQQEVRQQCFHCNRFIASHGFFFLPIACLESVKAVGTNLSTTPPAVVVPHTPWVRQSKDDLWHFYGGQLSVPMIPIFHFKPGFSMDAD